MSAPRYLPLSGTATATTKNRQQKLQKEILRKTKNYIQIMLQ
jgi:hypothetical protein